MSLFKPKADKLVLSSSDLVILTMMNFPNGAVGESTIHEFVYALTERDEFKKYRDMLDFKVTDKSVFSGFIHRAIQSNTKKLRKSAIYEIRQDSDITYAMFSDELRFDLYEIIKAKEEDFAKNVREYTPEIFYLTAPGLSVGSLISKEKLNENQRKVLRELANAI